MEKGYRYYYRLPTLHRKQAEAVLKRPLLGLHIDAALKGVQGDSVLTEKITEAGIKAKDIPAPPTLLGQQITPPKRVIILPPRTKTAAT